MRDLGLVKVDEPFTKLLTQGMVLNHIYSRRTDKGGKDYFWPHDVEHVLADDGKVIGARLKNAVGRLACGHPHRLRRRGYHVQVEKQRRRSTRPD
jgi:leucyl-tRNA synthetase